MPLFSVPLPGTGRELNPGPAVAVAASALAAPLFVPLILAATTAGTGAPAELIFVLGVAIGAGYGVAAALCLGRSVLDAWRAQQMHASGRDLGFTPQPRPIEYDLVGYEELPLFRYTREAERAAVWAMAGRFEGVPMRLVEFAYEGMSVDPRGHRRTVREVQTLAILEQGGPEGRFHLGPGKSTWEDLEPGWAEAQGLEHRVEFGGGHLPIPPALHADCPATLEAFTPRRREALAAFGGWVVEGAAGTLVVYRHDHAVEPHELAGFLEAVKRIVAVFRKPPETPARSEQIQEGMRASPSDALRRGKY